jgi:hypothetical protein
LLTPNLTKGALGGPQAHHFNASRTQGAPNRVAPRLFQATTDVAARHAFAIDATASIRQASLELKKEYKFNKINILH